MRARFGPFLFDSQTRELIHEAERIHLTAKAMRLLELLLSRRPEVVSRQQLYDHLWPDVAVSEANLKNLVAEIRRALGEAGGVAGSSAPCIITATGSFIRSSRRRPRPRR